MLLMRSCSRAVPDASRAATLWWNLLLSYRRGLYFGGQVSEAPQTFEAIKAAGVGEFSPLFFGLADFAGDDETAKAMRFVYPSLREEFGLS